MIKNLLILSAFLPVIGLLIPPADAMLLIYTIFVVIYLSKTSLSGAIRGLKIPFWLFFLLLVLASGWLTEMLAWNSNYLAKTTEPALFHPQLFYDLILATGFYLGNALAWLLLLRKYRFSLPAVFIIQGFFGVFFEQDGAVFYQGLASLPAGLLLWGYVFLVYGSIIAIPYVLVREEIMRTLLPQHWWQYPLALVIIRIGILLIFYLWATPWQVLQLIPPPQPMITHPFW